MSSALRSKWVCNLKYFSSVFLLSGSRYFTSFIMPPMPKNLTEYSKEEFKTFVDSFDIVLSDCDGVLWLDNAVIKDSENVLNKFRKMGKGVMFVTNNSTKTKEDLLVKCEKLGFEAEQDDIVSTAHLAASHLKESGFNKKVYLIGSQGIAKELDRFQIPHTEIGPDTVGEGIANYIETKFRLDSDVGAVVVGFDDHFSYPKMLKAASYLNNPNCLFIGTNTDEQIPIREDLIVPGTGSIIKCLETASNRKAYVVGKPNDHIKKAVIQKRGIHPKRTLMIGDRANTDILFGHRCGFQTLLVLTGVTKLQEVQEWCNSDDASQHELVADTYAKKLGDILPLLESL